MSARLAGVKDSDGQLVSCEQVGHFGGLRRIERLGLCAFKEKKGLFAIVGIEIASTSRAILPLNFELEWVSPALRLSKLVMREDCAVQIEVNYVVVSGAVRVPR